MREILFRGKRVIDGKWVESRCPLGEMHSGTVTYDFFPETVCQYTGLTDKNGRKIFEGDIVQCYPFKAVVRFGEFENQVFKNLGFNLDWIKELSYRQDLLYWASEIEVVGNIFDNSELIEK